MLMHVRRSRSHAHQLRWRKRLVAQGAPSDPGGGHPRTGPAAPAGAGHEPHSWVVTSQTYHDLFISRDFGRRGGGSFGANVLDGLTVQLGIRNLFDTEPPLDAYYRANYFVSPFGDTRLRSYWLNLRKAFGVR